MMKNEFFDSGTLCAMTENQRFRLTQFKSLSQQKTVFRLQPGVNKMINKDPQNKQIPVTISLDGLPANRTTSIEDTVSVKDSAVYQFQKWKYLVKKQTVGSGKDELLMWFDQLAGQGWELINSQPANLGFYIFKKTAN
jgi:hypothetical protein